MKLSKSKLALAKVINENGGWKSGGIFSCQDGNGRIDFYQTEPHRIDGNGWWTGDYDDGFGITPLTKTPNNWHKTILSREEYYQAYPKADADGWIECNGGECPVEKGTLVDVKYASGVTNFGVSALTSKSDDNHRQGACVSFLATNWDSGLPMSGIVAYRLHKPDVKSTAVGDDETNLATKKELETMQYKPSIEQLMQRYVDKCRSLKIANEHLADCTRRAREAMDELSAACKSAGFEVSPISAKQEPEVVITDWRDLQVGDKIEYLDGKNIERFGMIGVVDLFDESDETGRNVRMVNDAGDVGWPTRWRFIRRP